MPIKARPFTTKIGEVEVEGLFEEENFVFRFYGLVTFRPPLTSGNPGHSTKTIDLGLFQPAWRNGR